MTTTLRAVAAMMAADVGAPVEASDIVHAFVAQNAERCAIAEADLLCLTQDELETLAIGDQEDWPAILEMLDDPQTTHEVLEELFVLVGDDA